MATIDNLASETLYHIMEMLKEPSPDWEDGTSPPGRYDALRAAALVCSRWWDPAQRTLFDEVVISDEDYFPKAQLFSDSPARSRYRTRSLCTSGHLDWSLVLDVAEECNGLRELRAMGGSRPMIWSDLTRPCFAGLKGIDICGGSFMLRASREALETLELRIPANEAALSSALLYVGPHLRHLVLDATYRVLKTYLNFFPVFRTLESFSCIGTNDFTSLTNIIAILDHSNLILLTKLDFPFLPSSVPPAHASVVASMAKEFIMAVEHTPLLPETSQVDLSTSSARAPEDTPFIIPASGRGNYYLSSSIGRVSTQDLNEVDEADTLRRDRTWAKRRKSPRFIMIIEARKAKHAKHDAAVKATQINVNTLDGTWLTSYLEFTTTIHGVATVLTSTVRQPISIITSSMQSIVTRVLSTSTEVGGSTVIVAFETVTETHEYVTTITQPLSLATVTQAGHLDRRSDFHSLCSLQCFRYMESLFNLEYRRSRADHFIDFIGNCKDWA
ncbi:hypothetical protein RQP46_006097 [Phenoliferia psychrophenolica]